LFVELAEDPQTRFRRLAESAACKVTDVVMKSVVRHFAPEMTVVNSASQAYDLYKRASLVPRSATQIVLKVKNISVGEIFGGADNARSIILEAFEDGNPCLLKITDTTSIDHEMSVWEAIRGNDGDQQNLVPLKKLEFISAAVVQVGNLSGGYNDTQGDFRAGILMRKFQSTLARCKIPLTEGVLLRYGEQLKTAITTMHEHGYCHMDIKPANVFLWEGSCFLGDYGGATKIGERVRERTVSYYPSDAGDLAKKKTDFMLLTVLLLEMFGAVSSPPGSMTAEEIKSKVASVEDEKVKAFLEQLGSFDD
jgi:serine/threonine protein kinase